MLAAIGVASTDQLFADIPPEHARPALDLPPALSELELLMPMRRARRTDCAAQHAGAKRQPTSDFADVVGPAKFNSPERQV